MVAAATDGAIRGWFVKHCTDRADGVRQQVPAHTYIGMSGEAEMIVGAVGYRRADAIAIAQGSACRQC
jgi:hypothetical protein